MDKKSLDRYIRTAKMFYFTDDVDSEDLVSTAHDAFGVGNWISHVIDNLIILGKDNETIYKVLEVLGYEIVAL